MTGRLDDKLRRLAADRGTPDPQGLRLDADALAALAAEIDETVLPRRLVLTRDTDGATLALDVSSRRLRRVVEAPEPALIDRPLSGDDAAEVARLLHGFLSAGGPIRLRPDPAPDEFTATGISTQRLAAALTEIARVSTPAEVFADAARHAVGALLLSSKAPPMPVGEVVMLTAVTIDALTATRQIRRSAGPVAVAILGVTGGRRLVIASAPEAEAIFLAESAKAETIATTWRRLAR